MSAIKSLPHARSQQYILSTGHGDKSGNWKRYIGLVQNTDKEYIMGARHAKLALTIMDYETPMQNSHLK